MKLLFVEFEDEAMAAIEHIQKTENISNLRIFALTLQAQIFLKKKNIPFETSMGYFDNASHEKCLLKSDSLMSFMEGSIQIPENSKVLVHNDSYIYYIRYFNNHMLYLIELLSNILDSGKCSEAYVCVSENSGQVGAFITDDERYLHTILERICKLKKIKIKKFPVIKTTKENSQSGKSKPLQNTTPKKPAGKLLLVPSCAYGLDNVIQKIKSHNRDVSVVYAHEKEIPFFNKFYYMLMKGVNHFVPIDQAAPDSAYPLVRRDDLEKVFGIISKNSRLFEYRGIDFIDLLKTKVSAGINPAIMKMSLQCSRLSTILKTFGPDLTISYSGKNLTYALGELCRLNNLEAICISHGTVVPPKNEIEEIVNRNIGTAVILNRYPSVAVQTPWCEKFLNHYKHISKDIITGPLLFRDNLEPKKPSPQKKKTLVHAVTLKMRSSTKFWGVETPDEFVESVASLIRSVGKVSDTNLIIHLHPAYKESFRKGELEMLLPKSDCYTVIYGGSIYDSLSKADFLVSFSSTTIEEAVMNKIPVILYDKWGRYKHFEAVDLNKSGFKPAPVYYASSEEVFLKHLPRILSDGTSDKIKSTLWSEYRYDEKAKSGFYDYLDQYFKKN
ncbi:hypothetical protein KKF81_01755 [Candidatus Micrarchaeota archaeon]|nr:hypothetical protein [Candidatus Micrarchaeota archaeon]